MLLKIGSYDFTDIIGYTITHKDKVKTVENANGDESVYVIAEGKATLEIQIGALSQDKLSALLNAIGIVSTVTYADVDGTEKTRNFKRGDIRNGLMYKLDEGTLWEEQTITLTQL